MAMACSRVTRRNASPSRGTVRRSRPPALAPCGASSSLLRQIRPPAAATAEESGTRGHRSSLHAAGGVVPDEGHSGEEPDVGQLTKTLMWSSLEATHVRTMRSACTRRPARGQ
jgi:hypothetical protein